VNTESYREGNKLVIIVNLDRELEGENRISKSGKSIMVAKTVIRHENSLGEKVTLALNAYKKNK
jgi:hypothetical protein